MKTMMAILAALMIGGGVAEARTQVRIPVLAAPQAATTYFYQCAGCSGQTWSRTKLSYAQAYGKIFHGLKRCQYGTRINEFPIRIQ